MKNFKMVQALLISGVVAFCARSSSAAMYTIQWGTGDAPFQYHPEVADYQVDGTGIQSHQGVHGFVTHHDGTDTSYDIPGENFYIALLHVNESGQVAGTYNANYGGSGCYSFLWNQGQLSIFPGLSDAHVMDLNNQGEVVGNCLDRGDRMTFVWDDGLLSTFRLFDYVPTMQYNGESYSTGFNSTMVEAVNDNGQLLGHFTPMYSDTPGLSFWYIATPVPEPASGVLIAVGLFAFVRSRKRVG